MDQLNRKWGLDWGDINIDSYIFRREEGCFGAYWDMTTKTVKLNTAVWTGQARHQRKFNSYTNQLQVYVLIFV